jgi:hypothetical protein
VRSEIVQIVVGLDAVQLAPPGEAVTVYVEIAEPPSVTDADHETVTCPDPVI